ncbi:MAG: hypothetical protein WAT09_07545 [Paracoccaceae bacterium]
MSFSIFRNAAFAAAVSLVPTVSLAQDVFGTIDANIDGKERTWFLTSQDNTSQTFGLTIAIANLQSFSLWGQPTEQSLKAVDDSLLFTFDVMSVADQMIPLNASVMFLEDGWKSGWLANEADKISLSLTTLKKSDEGVFVEGNFNATAGYAEPLSSGEVDASRTKQITGSFSATLPLFVLKEQ